MLQVLSWNAYNHNTPSPMSNISSYLPSPDTPRMSSPAPSKMTKRKRASEGESESKRQDSGLEKGAVHLVTGSTHSSTPAFSGPPFQLMQQPSDGLPTPLLSPTAANMDNKGLLEVLVKPVEAESAEVRRNKTRQVVAQQVNLEILLKHEELRLIDQEIAKCQVSLEQLRRCTEIPYPATQLSQSVSSGAGAALRAKYSGARLPTSPAPWGVTDGPYSRHYASWLLPDSAFDGGEPDSAVQTPINGKRPAKGRHGRPSVVEDMQHAGMSSRSQRNGSLQSLGNANAQPKEKSQGPLILKRSSDGKMVKLKCLDCGRHNFGSAQGFINHCRIGHGRTFPSHDAAAESCGEPVEYDASGAIMGIEPATSTPVAANVHALIRTAHTLPKELGPTPKVRVSHMDGPADSPQVSKSSAFTSAVSTPFLSALVQNRGLGLDLHGAVTDAKTKTELLESDIEMSEDEEERKVPGSGLEGRPQVAGTRQVGPSSKAPSTSPFYRSRIPSLDGAADFGHAIEPSPTTDSNQAPSLIDDDEEFEAHSPASTPASELSDEDLHICVRDDDEPHSVELSRPEFQPSCASTEEHVSSSPTRRASAFRKETETREEKHVSFDNGSLSEDSPSNRRKITK